MWDVVGWLVVLALIALMLWALARDNRHKRNRTKEEYERDLAEAQHSLMRAGMLELNKFFSDAGSKRAAVEYLKDEEQGMTKTGGSSEDDKRTGVEP